MLHNVTEKVAQVSVSVFNQINITVFSFCIRLFKQSQIGFKQDLVLIFPHNSAVSFEVVGQILMMECVNALG